MTFEQRIEQAPRYDHPTLKEGEERASILVDCNVTLHDGRKLDWVGVINVPFCDSEGNEYDPEGLATCAFLLAQGHGLESRLMCLCAFYAFDGEGWWQFL